MYSPRLKRGYFLLEGLNSLSTTYFFYYVYFLTEAQFGFSKTQNLVLAAALGFMYGVSSAFGGRLAQRCGYFTALKAGFGLMMGMFAVGPILPQKIQIASMFVANFGMALTWPALEALVSEGEPADRLQRNVGIYNLVWAGFGAVAYFSGGAIINAWSFKAMFLVPAAVQAVQLILTLFLERAAKSGGHAPASAGHADVVDDEEEKHRSPVSPQTFLKMAWLANPFGYLAISTVVAVIPAVAKQMHLSVMWAGIVCSVWLFVRTASFGLLWWWNGWHYRFRWLAAGYIGMACSFVALLVAPSVFVLVVAQVFFGLGLGLLYYSSLYYSMHVGEAKGEHGGLHEAMIGAGSCAGPAVGALTLHYLPQYASGGTYAVGGMLVTGLIGLSWMRWRRTD
jgi:MFS family permease